MPVNVWRDQILQDTFKSTFFYQKLYYTFIVSMLKNMSISEPCIRKVITLDDIKNVLQSKKQSAFPKKKDNKLTTKIAERQ